jgi:hypothetical protein
MSYLALSDWERLERLPMIVETFFDYDETERSKKAMSIVAIAATNANKFVRVTITSPRAPRVIVRGVNDALMDLERATRYFPRKYVQAGDKELQYPERPFNEMA